MPRRRYTRTEKARAVAEAVMSGSIAASEHTGIPDGTIRDWVRSPEFAGLRDKGRDDVAGEFWAGIQVGLRRIVDLIPLTDDLQKVGVVTGILYDKHALLTGGATGRTESRDLTGTLSDAEIVDAIHEAERIATAERAAPPAEGSPEI